jgi:hypothetical protein
MTRKNTITTRCVDGHIIGGNFSRLKAMRFTKGRSHEDQKPEDSLWFFLFNKNIDTKVVIGIANTNPILPIIILTISSEKISRFNAIKIESLKIEKIIKLKEVQLQHNNARILKLPNVSRPIFMPD